MAGRESTSPVCHPRAIELARRLKDHELEWEVQTGDWFETDGELHIVIEQQTDEDQTLLVGRTGNTFKKSEVTHLPHRSDCLEWIASKSWRHEITESDTMRGWIKVKVTRRNTEFKIEKVEPTELAAIYAAMLEVLDLEHFGWV